jgi:uncharacterized protein (TIGR02996 family)
MTEIITDAQAGRWYAVLDALLALWRAAPNRELADVIGEVSTHAATAASWDNIDDPPAPLAVERLLATVLDKGANRAWERVRSILTWPADPRIDRWVAATYADPPPSNSGTHSFWERIATLVVRIQDSHAATVLERLATRERIQPPTPNDVRDVPFAAGTREIIDAVRDALRSAMTSPARHGDAHALYDAVLANPDDDATRGVLGDVLLEQGDPRGELIALQLRTPPDDRRIKALIKRHAPYLLGALAPVLREYTFTRGFLSRAVVKGVSSKAIADAIAGCVGDPLWATVEHLEGGSEALVMHPIMRALRSLAHTKVGLGALARLPRLEALTTTTDDKDWLIVANDPAAFATLRRLAISPHAVTARTLFTLPLVRRLDTLDVRLAIDNWPTPNTDAAFELLRSAARLGPREVTIRFVRNRARDWHSAFHFEGGEVTVTRSETIDAGFGQLVDQDIERGLATLAAT